MNQKVPINHPSITLEIKREDLLHPYISGNKFRKLKYNLQHASALGATTLLTFGGAFSNHVVAVAAAGAEFDFQTIGIIRGEELAHKYLENPTLALAEKMGMKLLFIKRQQYKDKDLSSVKDELPINYYTIPEGGTNEFAIKGCEEILTENDGEFDYICCAVGTGGTIVGISNSAKKHQKVIGFPALKADLYDDIKKLTNNKNWLLQTEYHFGGYAKVSAELIHFINTFYKDYNIKLDPIYTGKLVYGVIDLIAKNYFPENSKILIVHTGGLQGISGMNQKLKSKNLPLIDSND